MNTPLKVLLVGPRLKTENAWYGGGMGGYVRFMIVYCQCFRSERFEMRPCYNSIRLKTDGSVALVLRMFRDVLNFARMVPSAPLVHILGAYRRAIVREAAMVWLARLMGKPVVYDIRAGELVSWYEKTGGIGRFLFRATLRGSSAVLCEGTSVVAFLEQRFQQAAAPFPTPFPDADVPASVPTRLVGSVLRVLFVGWAYEGKGVLELVRAAEICHQRGLPLEITFAGAEHPDFTRLADQIAAANPGLAMRRLGLIDQEAVLAEHLAHDVFCLPTRHVGEGHPNVLNEAMMSGSVIVTTQHGFIGDVLNDQCAYFVAKSSPEDIARAFQRIWENRDEARAKASAGRERLRTRYLASVLSRQLEALYQRLLEPGRGRGRTPS